MLFDEEHPGTRGACREELREMSGHRSEVVRDKEPSLCGGHCQHVRVAETVQLRGACGGESIAGSRRTQPVTIA